MVWYGEWPNSVNSVDLSVDEAEYSGLARVKTYVDTENNFIETFDSSTGFYVRSGVLANGIDTGVDPFMRNYPQLIDIGVMGTCAHALNGLCRQAGVQCYQKGNSVVRQNMSVGDFVSIAEQCASKVFQFALGGRGDVDQHPQFEKLLAISRECGIVPNFTTSGIKMSSTIANVCKRYVGAIAVSWYRSQHTLDAISTLLRSGIKTNIHYVLGNNTIDEAIKRLEDRSFPRGINAVIFLLHKPVGFGEEANVLQQSDPKVGKFFRIIDTLDQPYMIGFDSCSVPALVTMAKSIDHVSTDCCEGARYSCYIDAQMNMTPCSFAQDTCWFVDLRTTTIADAWNSEPFQRFRHTLRNSCPDCPDQPLCRGGCPIVNRVTLCSRKERCYDS